MLSNNFKFVGEPLFHTHYNECIDFMFCDKPINELRKVNAALKSDLMIAVLAVLKKACAVSHLPDSILRDRTICRLAAKSDGRTMRFFAAPPIDYNIAMAAIESQPSSIVDIPPALRWHTRILKKYINEQKLHTAASAALGAAACDENAGRTLDIIPRHRHESPKEAQAALYNYFAN